ncbi:MAG: hypothetical protein R3337_09495, partial [Gammaproteobacteria bacterium]|nr:hypothetical protein [Gammaproteobacteria bacterium]
MFSVDEYAAELRRITRKTTDYGEIFDQVIPLAREVALSKGAWVRPEHYVVDEEQGFGVHHLR